MNSRPDRVLMLEMLDKLKPYPALYKKMKRGVLEAYRVITHAHYEAVTKGGR